LGIGWGSRDYYLNETLYADQLKAYSNYLRTVVDILQNDINDRVVPRQYQEADLVKIVKFETSLAQVDIA
jgi:hypothetical protein